MKQKVTIKVGMECDCCRNKALKIASMIKGVSAVAIEGDSKDLVVVTGNDVDTVCLGRNLRKKFRIVTVLTVEEVKPPPPKKPDPPKKEESKEKPKVVTVCMVQPAHPCVLCCSPTCHGGCKPCCKCQSHKCDGKCEHCGKCGSHKCEGGCKPCCKCQSHKCDGKCEQCGKCGSHKCEGGCKACSRCGSYRCHGHCAPAVSCYGQCPPWLLCPSCCTMPPSARCYTVVYEAKPADPCSIQ
ncbi:hypothetical protein QN277_007425 [Acacia crassicarpa]|uniref:HMA domain-containing protein n=1 Tax=Acacia crassicarpa TaxID=499986 RepID=A0AAE1IW25_9FABA|nr:hypothetical protein QN277_007425 [Acacia crassicarpa]